MAEKLTACFSPHATMGSHCPPSRCEIAGVPFHQSENGRLVMAMGERRKKIEKGAGSERNTRGKRAAGKKGRPKTGPHMSSFGWPTICFESHSTPYTCFNSFLAQI